MLQIQLNWAAHLVVKQLSLVLKVTNINENLKSSKAKYMTIVKWFGHGQEAL